MEQSNPPPPVQSGMVDTHCHLFLLKETPESALEEARVAGVSTLVCVGIDPESSRRSVELAESFRGVFATAGMHPHTASDLGPREESEIEEMVANPQVVAVGETGLDFFRMRSPRNEQERAFRSHITLAREADLPLVVHVREAWPSVLQLLDEGSAERVVLHCFSGDVDVAGECAARGYFVSFAGNVTYPNNEHLRRATRAVPLDRLLVETDSPFLSPQSRRGRDNTPASIPAVIEELARGLDMPTETVARVTTTNARRAFPRLQ
jgi:TatD DNase family protein